MAKSRTSLIKPRTIAFNHQGGCCFYCDQPMWQSKFLNYSKKYNLTSKQAKKMQATGEHLIPHQDGGSSKQSNIVAACKFCNQQRHKRNVALSPKLFKAFINRRMKQGRWHNFRAVTIH
ncbi:MAG: HNH endonuclease [Piscirickettsiaceae bacterium]|nr:HNH endonuclease [Piscirickettsiaceae bacterium]